MDEGEFGGRGWDGHSSPIPGGGEGGKMRGAVSKKFELKCNNPSRTGIETKEIQNP